MKNTLEILVATSNAGKIREIQTAFLRFPVRLIYLDDFPGISTVAEVAQTYEGNATLKALGYSRQTGLCALADDSGLEVDALHGQPGVFSARFAGEHASDTERNEKLLAALSAYAQARAARFVCAMALAGWNPGEAPGPETEPFPINVTEASCEGSIAMDPRGVHGFGYDPVFVPKGYHETFGELPDGIKSRISHRALALNQMSQFLERWLAQT